MQAYRLIVILIENILLIFYKSKEPPFAFTIDLHLISSEMHDIFTTSILNLYHDVMRVSFGSEILQHEIRETLVSNVGHFHVYIKHNARNPLAYTRAYLTLPTETNRNNSSQI